MADAFKPCPFIPPEEQPKLELTTKESEEEEYSEEQACNILRPEPVTLNGTDKIKAEIKQEPGEGGMSPSYTLKSGSGLKIVFKSSPAHIKSPAYVPEMFIKPDPDDPKAKRIKVEAQDNTVIDSEADGMKPFASYSSQSSASDSVSKTDIGDGIGQSESDLAVAGLLGSSDIEDSFDQTFSDSGGHNTSMAEKVAAFPDTHSMDIDMDGDNICLSKDRGTSVNDELQSAVGGLMADFNQFNEAASDAGHSQSDFYSTSQSEGEEMTQDSSENLLSESVDSVHSVHESEEVESAINSILDIEQGYDPFDSSMVDQAEGDQLGNVTEDSEIQDQDDLDAAIQSIL